MQCRVDGCERDAPYKTAQLCQKHYFRMRRTGTVQERKVGHVERFITPNGYARIYQPGHPLADKRGYVFEHRYVMWGTAGGVCTACEKCGRPESWSTCHVDHKDDDRLNNSTGNLRILCRGCNVKRGFTPESFALRGKTGLIEFEGKRQTAAAWARDPRVEVSGATIIRRKASGMSDFDALFAPKVTHNGKAKYRALVREMKKATENYRGVPA